MAWLRRMFRRQPDQERLMKVEQRSTEAESQATVAVERAKRVLKPDRDKQLADAYRRAHDAFDGR